MGGNATSRCPSLTKCDTRASKSCNKCLSTFQSRRAHIISESSMKTKESVSSDRDDYVYTSARSPSLGRLLVRAWCHRILPMLSTPINLSRLLHNTLDTLHTRLKRPINRESHYATTVTSVRSLQSSRVISLLQDSAPHKLQDGTTTIKSNGIKFRQACHMFHAR